MKYETSILKRLIDTYGVVGNPRYISEIIKEFIVRGKERFPELFTYQADWLAHIDEFGLNPTYMVSYTGQSIYAPNTLERPVKSAILKGQTLVNIKENQVSLGQVGRQVEYEIPLVKINTKYFIKYKFTSTSSWVAIGFLNNSLSWSSNRENQPLEGQFILNSGTNPCYFRIGGLAGTITTVDYLMIIEYQEGMENWDIPYFEGMQSVKMPVLTTTGKNLLNLSPDTLERLTINGNTGVITGSDTRCTTKYIKATPEDDLFLKRFNTNYKVAVRYYHNDKFVNKGLNGGGSFIPDGNLKVANNDYYNQIRLVFAKQDDSEVTPQEISSQQIMLTSSKGGIFEPYRTNILMANEEVELRGIGDVQDSLDISTGEKVERIGEVFLNGSESWSYNPAAANKDFGISGFSLSTEATPDRKWNAPVLCDKMPVITSLGKVGVYNGQGLNILIKSDSTNVNTLKEILAKNPITIQYELATESVKTVDLTILDQNGQNVKQLMSFNGGTHFNTRSSEGSPLPTVSISVETDLEETLKMCSLDGNTM